MNPLSRKPGRRSMALVVTLVLVTLTSALVVAFTMKARMDLAAAASYAAVPQADGIARGGVEFLIGWLRREIQDGSTTYSPSGGNPGPGEPAAYAPLDEGNLLPQRTIERAGGASPYYQALLKISKRGEEFFRARKGWQFNNPASFDFVSDVSTKDSSANGRFYGPERWRAPGLLTRDEEKDFDDQTAKEQNLPDWIYVTREGPKKVAEVDQKQRDESAENPDYVLGRFSYAVYDTSGLLDVSVAGYPGELKDYEYFGTTGIVSKSSLVWADPSLIEVDGAGGGQAVKREELVAWRNAASKGQRLEDFLGYVTNAAKMGFLTNAAGDNGFFSRSDLIRFARSSVGAKVVSTNALPYLTTFSREKNAPSWAPKNYTEAPMNTCTIQYGDDAYREGTTNRWAAGVLVKQAFKAPAPGKPQFDDSSPEAITFNVGDPLLKRRFPLSRIELLNPSSGADRRLIQYYFGLVFGGQSQGPVPVWQYRPYGTAGGETGESQRMFTLDEIASLGREPNFFELIAAGVLSGSLGKTGMQWENLTDGGERFRERALDYRLAKDASAYHQILQIGANIIDQYDNDDWPTTIWSVARLSQADTDASYNNDIILRFTSSIRGIENLPYVSSIMVSTFRDITKKDNIDAEWTTLPKDMDGDGVITPYPSGDYGFGYTPQTRAQWTAITPDPNNNIIYDENGAYQGQDPNQHPWIVKYLHFQLWNPNRNALDATPGKYRIIAQRGWTFLKPPRGCSGDPGKWPNPPNSDPRSYCFKHFDKVDRRFFREQYYRYGRQFATEPASIEFRSDPGKTMFQQPKMLRPRDVECPITVGNRDMDEMFVEGARIAGFRLGHTLAINNLDRNMTNYYYLKTEIAGMPDDDKNNFTAFDELRKGGDPKYAGFNRYLSDWTYSTDSNSDKEPADSTYGPTTHYRGSIPLVIELQKEIDGAWVTYYSLVPRRSGDQFAGVPRWDTHKASYRPNGTMSAVYQNGFGFAGRFCPVSDPRCHRFGFTSGGDSGTGTGAPERGEWKKIADRTLRYSNFYAKNYVGVINSWGTRLDPVSGWWMIPWEAGPYGWAPESQNNKDNSIKWDETTLYSDDANKRRRAQVAPAALAENCFGQGRMGENSVMYAVDRDGVVRRGDGWKDRGIDPFSMNDLKEVEKTVARPIHLNRPFQSVAEMGYVLRDDPWKTLNFFWNDSADAGLLDYFCLYEGEQFRPAVAGVVNPNTASGDVLKALIKDTALHGNIGGVVAPRLSEDTAEKIALKIREYIGDANAPTRVIRSRGDLVEMVDWLFRDDGIRSAVAQDAGVAELADTDTGREAVVRSLSDVCNTRTWNLLLDVVAQSGRFTAASRQAGEFVVSGERRLWVHLALDRFTGEVVDMDIEPVFE